jgi:hypothetical protein
MTIRPASRQPPPPADSGDDKVAAADSGDDKVAAADSGDDKVAAADSGDDKVAALVVLAYELLDAHADTARLDADGAAGADWDNHLAYLRDLQRVGRETLARVSVSSAGAVAQ